jgi:hypothetical protein
MKVSFDFDGTLEFEYVQEFAKSLIKRGIEVWIVTTRYDANHDHKWRASFPEAEWASIYDQHDGDPNFHVWGVAEKLNIPKHHVRFTCMEYKHKYLSGTKFVFHLDDNPEEMKNAITHKCNVPFVDVDHYNWQNQCEELIQQWLNKPEKQDHE